MNLVTKGHFCARPFPAFRRGWIAFLLTLILGFHAFAGDQCSTLFKDRRSSLREYSAEMADHTEIEWKRELHELKEIAFLNADPTQAKEKLATLLALGFEIRNGELIPPSFDPFVKNYIQLLNSAKVPEGRRILPATVLVRGVGDSRQYRLVTPGLDPWPSEPGFRVLKGCEEFNLPAEVVREGLLRGRYPLMDSPHDIFHFVSFAMNPKYMMALYEGHQRIAHLSLTTNLERRIFFAQEALSLGDPQKISAMKNIFAASRAGVTESFSAYADFYRKMPHAELVAHANSLIQKYESLLVDYGGGVVRSWEKVDNLQQFYWDRYEESYLTSVALSAARGSLIFRDNAELLFGGTMSSFPFVLKHILEMRNLPSDQILKIVQRNGNLLYFLVDPKSSVRTLRPDYLDLLDQIIADHIARMEFVALKTAQDFPVEKWIEQSFREAPEPDLPLVQFVNEAYPIPGRGWNRMFQSAAP